MTRVAVELQQQRMWYEKQGNKYKNISLCLNRISLQNPAVPHFCVAFSLDKYFIGLNRGKQYWQKMISGYFLAFWHNSNDISKIWNLLQFGVYSIQKLFEKAISLMTGERMNWHHAFCDVITECLCFAICFFFCTMICSWHLILLIFGAAVSSHLVKNCHLVFLKLNQLHDNEDDPQLALKCNNVVDCEACGVCFNIILTFCVNITHECWCSYASLT